MKIDCLDKGYVRYINHMGSDLDIVNAARVSYAKEVDSLSERDERLVAFLWRDKHYSTFRHSVLSFEVRAPLMIARQWYKHAVASAHWEGQFGWNENSRRYVTEEPEFYIPAENEWRSKPANSKQGSGDPVDSADGLWLTHDLLVYIQEGINLYNAAMGSGVCAEQARLFLPAYGMYVNWRWTVSLDGVINFLNLRMADDAQKEFEPYTNAVITIVKDKFPVVGSLIETK
jgi:thymidylate synthase (FAD)